MNEYRQENKHENIIENANSKKKENTNRKDNNSEQNLKSKNNLFQKLTTIQFRQPLVKQNTFKSLIMTVIC
jgi:hypothetical protein